MGKRKSTPRKPVAPVAGLAFSATGHISMVSDPIPGDKNSLELEMIDRFLTTFRHDFAVAAGSPRRPKPPSDWPDFEVEVAGRTVGVELTGAVHFRSAMIRDVRDRYAEEINRLLDDVRHDLQGFSIVLDDNHQRPRYPRVTTQAGRRLAAEIARALRAEVAHLDSLSPHAIRHRTLLGGTDGPVATALILRRASADSPSIVFNGTYLRDDSTFGSEVLDALNNKLRKSQYGSYEGALWLLLYCEPVAPVLWNEKTLAAAQELLLRASKDCPFEQVWFMRPLPGSRLAHLELLHPTEFKD